MNTTTTRQAAGTVNRRAGLAISQSDAGHLENIASSDQDSTRGPRVAHPVRDSPAEGRCVASHDTEPVRRSGLEFPDYVAQPSTASVVDNKPGVRHLRVVQPDEQPTVSRFPAWTSRVPWAALTAIPAIGIIVGVAAAVSAPDPFTAVVTGAGVVCCVLLMFAQWLDGQHR